MKTLTLFDLYTLLGKLNDILLVLKYSKIEDKIKKEFVKQIVSIKAPIEKQISSFNELNKKNIAISKITIEINFFQSSESQFKKLKNDVLHCLSNKSNMPKNNLESLHKFRDSMAEIIKTEYQFIQDCNNPLVNKLLNMISEKYEMLVPKEFSKEEINKVLNCLKKIGKVENPFNIKMKQAEKGSVNIFALAQTLSGQIKDSRFFKNYEHIQEFVLHMDLLDDVIKKLKQLGPSLLSKVESFFEECKQDNISMLFEERKQDNISMLFQQLKRDVISKPFQRSLRYGLTLKEINKYYSLIAKQFYEKTYSCKSSNTEVNVSLTLGSEKEKTSKKDACLIIKDLVKLMHGKAKIIEKNYKASKLLYNLTQIEKQFEVKFSLLEESNVMYENFLARFKGNKAIFIKIAIKQNEDIDLAFLCAIFGALKKAKVTTSNISDKSYELLRKNCLEAIKNLKIRIQKENKNEIKDKCFLNGVRKIVDYNYNASLTTKDGIFKRLKIETQIDDLIELLPNFKKEEHHNSEVLSNHQFKI